MAEDYNGWTIDVLEDEASFGDLTGYDVKQSMRAYCDALADDLRSAFPGAEVTVRPEFRTYNGGHVHVDGPDGQFAAPSDQPWSNDAADIREDVDQLRSHLFTRDPERWAIEVIAEPTA